MRRVMQLRLVLLSGATNHPDDAVERDDTAAGAGGNSDLVVAAPVDMPVDELTIEAGDLDVATDHPAGG